MTPLVGRSDELDQMRRWLAEALAGSPRIVVMTGEAGIGKSRLVNELISDARTANVRPFAGRCLEGSRVAFLPFTTLVDTLLPDHWSAEELIARLSRSLMTSAADRALLVVVEDAQWADDPSMELLAHIAATFAHEAVFRQLPVMLLVTARSSGVPPTVQRLLSRLGREVIGRTVRLGALDDLAVFAMLEACTGVSPSVQLLTHIQETTAGNPHEVEALLSRLEHAGALQVRGRELIATVEDYSTLPGDGDAAPLIAELSDAARLLLTTLALLRDGRVTSVRIASGLATIDFDAGLDEAIDAGLLTDDGVRLEFVHAATRHALVAGLGGRRRHRSHADIARRLADAPPDLHISATEIVDQLHRARDQADSLLLTRFARVAGDECLALGAHAEALRHYEAALSLPGLRDDMRAALEERAALAAYRNTDRSSATAHASRAIELAQRQGDLDTWGEAALLLARASS
ncbi:MAG TPA: AAA family ATPase, partial [Acidimicrobiia bacterium]|nr:AAA family ATPase [Acidimicrobiia bacterium]